MIKRSLFALLMGVSLAATLFYSSSVKAGCGGLCANRFQGLYYVGCSIFIDADEKTMLVSCFYESGGTFALADNNA